MAGRAVIRSIAWLGLALFVCPAVAADAPADLAGTYNGSQMEVGAELRLEPDGRYQYYFAYGALDEMSEGTWSADGDAIVLTSDPFKAPAFELVGSKPGKGATLDVTLDVPKGMDLQFFSALLVMPDRSATEASFDDGALHIPLAGANHPAQFVLGLEIYDVMSDLYDIPPNTRSIHFRFVPNELGKVAFDHQRLARDGDAFVLERFDRTLRFRKEAASEEQGEDAPADEQAPQP
jgi:hypothetical protein